MSTAARLVKGSIFRTADLVVVVGSAFFVTPYLVHGVGARVYGFWTLIMTLIGYYGLLDLGLSSAAARYLAQAFGKGDQGELDRVASTTFLLFTLVALAVWAAAALSAAACPLFVRRPAEVELFKRTLLVMGAAAAVQLRAKAYLGLLMAALDYDLIAGVSIVRTLLYAAGVYGVLRVHRGLVAVAAVVLAVNALQYFALFAACRLRFASVRFALLRFDREKIGPLLAYGWKTLVCQLGDVMRFRLDTVLIATFLNAAMVTPYAVGSRLVEAYQQIVYNTVAMMLPVFSRYEGEGDYAAIREALLKVTKLATIMSIFIGASVLFYGRPFIRRWMGPGFDGSYVVAAILAAAFMIELPQTPGIQLMYGLSKHKLYAVLSVWEGAANLVLSAVLLRWFGIYGVALGTAVEHVFFKLFVQPRWICGCCPGLSTREYLSAILDASLKTGGALGVYFLAVSRFVSPTYGSLAVCGLLQVALFAPVAYFGILGRGEREAVARALASVAPALRREAAAS